MVFMTSGKGTFAIKDQYGNIVFEGEGTVIPLKTPEAEPPKATPKFSVGDKVVPVSKAAISSHGNPLVSLENDANWQRSKERGYFFISDVLLDEIASKNGQPVYACCDKPNAQRGNYYLESDLIPYVEPKPEQKPGPFKIGDRVRVKGLKELHELYETIILHGGYDNTMDAFAGQVFEINKISEGTHVGYGLKGIDKRIWDERLLLSPNHCPEPKTITENGTTFIFNGPVTVCIIDLDGRKFKGVAKCAPEDNWDETIGKNWARIRAMRKMLNAAEKELRKGE